MPARVADASVLASLIFAEPRSEEARSLLQGAELFEPTLLSYELASVTRRKIQSAPERVDDWLSALWLGLDLDIRWVESDPVSVVRVAIESGTTVYDAAYLTLARELGAPLLTFDEKLARAAGGSR